MKVLRLISIALCAVLLFGCTALLWEDTGANERVWFPADQITETELAALH